MMNLFLANTTDAAGAGGGMFANHYPVEDALRLFGAVKDYGAQVPE